MTTNTNPHEQSRRAARDGLEYAYLRRGRISSAAAGQTDGQPTVSVQEAGVPADADIGVVPTVHGDKYVPPEGSPVLVSPAGENRYAVISSLTPETTTPALDPGERILSHPLSKANVRFEKDGTVYVNGADKVIINNGSQGVITDVQAGGTNSSGGITSLDITREDSILV